MKLNNGAPIEVPVQKAPLSDEQQRWLDDSVAQVSEERMRQFNLAITDIHSPTGYEREVNEYVVDHLNGNGFDAFYQRVDDLSGNAVGRLAGNGEGPSLMLYAPMDTHLEADPDKDIPWAARELRPDMLPNAYLDDLSLLFAVQPERPNQN